jgi:protocatechuate 3,4-dioxygenase beta subunit
MRPPIVIRLRPVKRIVLGAAAAAIVVAVVLYATCDGSSSKSSAKKPGEGTAGDVAGLAAGAGRKPAVDPRTLTRGRIAGTISAKDGGKPIAGATVCGAFWDEGITADDNRVPKCTVAGADGTYALDDLIPATYRVTASAPTFVSGRWRGPKPDRDQSFRLAAGEQRTGVDIALTGGAVEVRGIVSDISGGPIAEAHVVVSGEDWWDDSGAGFVTRSGADGAFVAWAEPGTIYAAASVDGYADADARGVAPTSKLEILMTPESALAGIVIDIATEKPVPGIVVSVEQNWGRGEDSGDGSARTDADGKFKITRLAPGRYKPIAQGDGRYGEPVESVLLGLGQTVDDVVIRAHTVHAVTGRIVIDRGDGKLEGCAEDKGWVSLRGKSGDRWFSDATGPNGEIAIETILPGEYTVEASCKHYLSEDIYPKITIAAADVTNQEWRVKPGAQIVGKVRTRAGTPVAAVNIQAQTIGGDPRAQKSWGWQETDDDGNFTVDGLVAGKYVLRLYGSKHPDPKKPVEVEVATGQTATAEIVVDDGGAIAGVVVDEQGKPVRDANVNASGDKWAWGGNDSARTGDDGTFTLDGLAAGSYRVTASRGWWDEMRRPGTSDDDVQGERVAVAAAQTARVRLVVESQNGTITGVVVDATGAPVSDAYLAAQREAEHAGAAAGGAARSSRWGWDRKPVMTDTAGTFKLTNLAPGKYTVRAYRRGGGEAVQEHVALGGKARLVLVPTGSISGTISIEGGGAIDEVSVSVSDRKTGFSRNERFFRTGGQFALRDLPAGDYTVVASAVAGQTDVKQPLAEGQHVANLALKLAPRVRVRGRVLALDDGKPVPGLMMNIRPQRGRGNMIIMGGGEDEKERITGADGTFVVEDAPPGRVTISGWAMDWENSPYGWLNVSRTLTGTDVDVGDLLIPKRRVETRDRGGDLGFTFKEQPPDIEPEDVKLEVSLIRPGGPAVKSGLEVGDTIVAIDGHDVTGVRSYLAWSLMRVPIGTAVQFGLARGAKVSITAGPQP